MDKSVSGNETSEEVTRESLIAISYSLPDKYSTSELLSEKVNGELVGGTDCTGEEKHRSNLISISYTQSPDTGVLPVTPEGLPATPGQENSRVSLDSRSCLMNTVVCCAVELY
jgi:hypothetical protein